MADYTNARKRKQTDNNNEDSDFSVGSIPGLDDKPKDTKSTTSKASTKKETSSTATAPKTGAGKSGKGTDKPNTDAMAEPKTGNKASEPTPEELEGTVTLKLRKDYEKLVHEITSKNDGIRIKSFDNYVQLNGKQIRVTRQDAENVFGTIDTGRWRMLFMNREGKVATFTDYEFVLGVLDDEPEERKELAQLNTRISSKSKDDMDKVRNMLGMTQAQFLEVVIKEFKEKVEKEMLE